VTSLNASVANLGASKANVSHSHATGDITSGVLSVARGGTGQGTLSAAIQDLLNAITTENYAILFRGPAGWQKLSPGNAGQFLKTNGAGGAPEWGSVSTGSIALHNRTGSRAFNVTYQNTTSGVRICFVYAPGAIGIYAALGPSSPTDVSPHDRVGVGNLIIPVPAGWYYRLRYDTSSATWWTPPVWWELDLSFT
jgi:hypothetical protein